VPEPSKASLTPPENLQATVSSPETTTTFPAPPRSRKFVKRLGSAGVVDLRRQLPIAEGAPLQDVRRRERHYRRFLAMADAFGIAFVLVTVLLPAFEPLLLLSIPLVILLNKLAGLYDRDDLVLRRTTLEEAPALAQITGLTALVTWLLHDSLSATTLTPPAVLAFWISGLAMLLTGRALARDLARRLSPAERCLMIGDSASIQAVREKLVHSCQNTEVVASIPLSAGAGMPSDLLRVNAFDDLVREHDVHRVIYAPTSTDGADTLDLIRIAKAVGVHVSVVPRLFEVVGSAVAFDNLDGLTVLGVPRFGLTRSSMFVKRAFDLVGAGVTLLLFAPVMAVIAAAIKLESRGPVFFRQTRVGRDGDRFEILKFRSMVAGADEQKRDLFHLNEAEGLFKIAEDPRITGVGRLIRRTSLDELPQLFNVVRGEMSLVGPRPLVVDEDEQVQGLDRSRLHLTPGMTGHWQVLGSARIPMAEMVAIDYLYVANWSLWSDVKLLLRTVPHVLSRRGM
jgi:exopolysaccharide biosynthesis polyprenyl glycosylphosphotransferase